MGGFSTDIYNVRLSNNAATPSTGTLGLVRGQRNGDVASSVRAECLTQGGQKTPRPHRVGVPYQGVDVRLDADGGGLGASMMARLCRSSSDLFLYRAAPDAGVQQAPTHLQGVLHEPAQRASPGSVIWAGYARDEALILTGCTLLAKSARLSSDGLPVWPAQIPVWLDGANPCVLDIGTVQSMEGSVFYRRSATVVQTHVRTLTFRDAAGRDVTVDR